MEHYETLCNLGCPSNKPLLHANVNSILCNKSGAVYFIGTISNVKAKYEL